MKTPEKYFDERVLRDDPVFRLAMINAIRQAMKDAIKAQWNADTKDVQNPQFRTRLDHFKMIEIPEC